MIIIKQHEYDTYALRTMCEMNTNNNNNAFKQIDSNRFFPNLLAAIRQEFKYYEQVRDAGHQTRAKHAVGNLQALFESLFIIFDNLPHLRVSYAHTHTHTRALFILLILHLWFCEVFVNNSNVYSFN